jgi:MFS family permease
MLAMTGPSVSNFDRGESIVARLGLNRSTAALLAGILLIGMGQELWAPFMPKFIQQTIDELRGDRTSILGLTPEVVVVLAVGLFGTWRDLQEGIYYYLGGRIGGALGTRRALIAFAAMPLVGYAVLLVWSAPYAPFVALPFIVAYDSIAQPATLTVIGQTLHERHRTMALSLQSIQRRIPRIIAYLTGGALVAGLGAIGGVRAAIAISAVLVCIALIVQISMLRSQTRDSAANGVGLGWGMFRRFRPELKRLLLADILARLAEGMPREFFILFAVLSLDADQAEEPAFGVFGISAATFGQLLALQAFIALATYIPVGWLTSRPGARKQPFVTLTFVFFALFPLAFWWLGHQFGLIGLVIAYVIGGLREIGEPARKAMITELVPPEARTAATGLYWATRTFAVMLAPLAGAAVWLTLGAEWVFVVAFAAGAIGAVLFWILDRRTLR